MLIIKAIPEVPKTFLLLVVFCPAEALKSKFINIYLTAKKTEEQKDLTPSAARSPQTHLVF